MRERLRSIMKNACRVRLLSTTFNPLMPKPSVRPNVPNFSSGPTAKRPGYSLDCLKGAPLGRSHRAKIGKAKLKQAIVDTKRLLQIPSDYRVGIVPASDTGAFEMAMWTMLGPRPVDVLHWESFGKVDVCTFLIVNDIVTLFIQRLYICLYSYL